jgi:hypothetical protein
LRLLHDAGAGAEAEAAARATVMIRDLARRADRWMELYPRLTILAMIVWNTAVVVAAVAYLAAAGYQR